MKNYFANLTTEAEITNVYKALRVALHPDNGGNTAAFQALGQQYAAAIAALRHDTAPDKGGELPAAVICLSEHSESSTIATGLLNMIDKTSQIPGISVELCGSWLWVTGNTRPVKEQLKALQFRFSGSKKAWYWHDPSQPYRRRSRRHYDMDEIRDLHGSQKLA